MTVESMLTEIPLLEVSDLKVHFPLQRKWPWSPARFVHAVDGIDLSVRRGTVLGVVGEWGSGKTTAALAIMRLLTATSGRIKLGSTELSQLGGEALRRQRGRLQIIFQDPYSSLNPRHRAAQIVGEPLDRLGIGGKAERAERVDELFAQVGLRVQQKTLFPHQFSGGQRQRLSIARALAPKPELVVCDEPLSALDVAIQAQILNLLRSLQETYNITYLVISHNLGVVRYLCDEIVVMYMGLIVEKADRTTLFRRPLHPYTKALISAIPTTTGKLVDRVRLQGDPPSPADPKGGCRFSGRCPLVFDRCHSESPQLRDVEAGHVVACHLY